MLPINFWRHEIAQQLWNPALLSKMSRAAAAEQAAKIAGNAGKRERQR